MILKTVKEIKDPYPNGKAHKQRISLADCLMAGLSIFSLKFPSLLQFEDQRKKDLIQHNLKKIYQIDECPSDTYLRERLDPVDPESLRPIFTLLLNTFQRSNGLKSYRFLNNYYLLSLDGTGYFSSDKVHCEHCCEKHHQNGKTTYYHQILAGVILHPDRREVLPICPEPILKQDGEEKNDCERNASKRLLSKFRKDHPHLQVIVIEDALASNGPHVEELMKHNMSFILGIKSKGNKSLFEELQNQIFFSFRAKEKEKEIVYHFRYINDVPINDQNPHIKVNALECNFINSKGKEQKFSWITNIEITNENAYEIMRGGRARWKIENETFNTLKNQGYHFEHNFGHGYQHLSGVFASLMMIAFACDQLFQISSDLFNAAWKNTVSKIALWERQRNFFLQFYINSWVDLFESIAYGHKGSVLTPDTS